MFSRVCKRLSWFSGYVLLIFTLHLCCVTWTDDLKGAGVVSEARCSSAVLCCNLLFCFSVDRFVDPLIDGWCERKDLSILLESGIKLQSGYLG